MPPFRRLASFNIAAAEMRMEYDLRTVRCCPSYGFRVAEAFVANDDAELYAVHFKNTALTARRPRCIFAWVELIFALIAQNFSCFRYDKGNIQEAVAFIPIHR